jgi:hypothetical protein
VKSTKLCDQSSEVSRNKISAEGVLEKCVCLIVTEIMSRIGVCLSVSFYNIPDSHITYIKKVIKSECKEREVNFVFFPDIVVRDIKWLQCLLQTNITTCRRIIK